MGAILQLLLKLPAILSIIHEIVLLVEYAFPKATGAQKLNAAVTTVQQIIPDLNDAIHSPGIQAIINLVVGLLNMPGGLFATAKTAKADSSAEVPPHVADVIASLAAPPGESPEQIAQDAVMEPAAPENMKWSPVQRKYVPLDAPDPDGMRYDPETKEYVHIDPPAGGGDGV